MPHTERLLPVLIGNDYEHVLAHTTIDRDTPGEVNISIKAVGINADILAAYLEVDEPLALAFVAIPVKSRKHHLKET